jgi:hypothetical protein
MKKQVVMKCNDGKNLVIASASEAIPFLKNITARCPCEPTLSF